MHWVIGMMGTGKSTVSAIAARSLGIPFFDIDQLVVSRSGLSITHIWGESGEQGFRAWERRVISDIPDGTGVAAAGGGAPVDAQNFEVISRGESVILLRCELSQLIERIGSGDGRPLLGPDPESALRRLSDEREEIYRALSTSEVDTTHLGPDEVAQELVNLWSA